MPSANDLLTSLREQLGIKLGSETLKLLILILLFRNEANLSLTTSPYNSSKINQLYDKYMYLLENLETFTDDDSSKIDIEELINQFVQLSDHIRK